MISIISIIYTNIWIANDGDIDVNKIQPQNKERAQDETRPRKFFSDIGINRRSFEEDQLLIQ